MHKFLHHVRRVFYFVTKLPQHSTQMSAARVEESEAIAETETHRDAAIGRASLMKEQVIVLRGMLGNRMD